MKNQPLPTTRAHCRTCKKRTVHTLAHPGHQKGICGRCGQENHVKR